MTSNLNFLDKAIVRIRNQGPVDFNFFDQMERAFLSKFEELSKSGLTPSRFFSLQEQFFRPSISTHQMTDLHAQAVVSSSRNHPCGLRHR